MLARSVQCALLLAAQAAHGASTMQDNAEHQLREKFAALQLMDPYSRPVKTWTDRIDAKVGLAVTGVMEIDQSAGTMKSTVELSLSWRDHFLTWQDDCTDVTGCFDVKRLFVDPAELWLPDVDVLNAVEITDVDAAPLATLYPNGTVVYVRNLVVVSRCKLDFENFPFDVQYCSIVLAPQVLTQAQQRIQYSHYTPNATGTSFDTITWAVFNTTLNATVLDESRIYASEESQVSQGVYTVPLARESMFYISNGVIPVILVTLMVYLSFWLPVSMVERMDFGATALLSIVAVMFVIADKLPTQVATTKMDTFFFISLLFNLIALVESAIVVTFATNVAFRSMKASVGFFFSPKFLDLAARFVWPVCYIVVCNNLLIEVLSSAGNMVQYDA